MHTTKYRPTRARSVLGIDIGLILVLNLSLRGENIFKKPKLVIFWARNTNFWPLKLDLISRSNNRAQGELMEVIWPKKPCSSLLYYSKISVYAVDKCLHNVKVDGMHSRWSFRPMVLFYTEVNWDQNKVKQDHRSISHIIY